MGSGRLQSKHSLFVSSAFFCSRCAARRGAAFHVSAVDGDATRLHAAVWVQGVRCIPNTRRGLVAAPTAHYEDKKSAHSADNNSVVDSMAHSDNLAVLLARGFGHVRPNNNENLPGCSRYSPSPACQRIGADFVYRVKQSFERDAPESRSSLQVQGRN